jgi:hypothetical protein
MLTTTLKSSAALKPSVARDMAVGLPSGGPRTAVNTNVLMPTAVRELMVSTCQYLGVELTPDPPGTPVSSSSTTLSTSPGAQSTAASNPLTSVGSGGTQTTTPGENTSGSGTSSGSGSNGGSSGTNSGSNSGSNVQPQSTELSLPPDPPTRLTRGIRGWPQYRRTHRHNNRQRVCRRHHRRDVGRHQVAEEARHRGLSQFNSTAL